MKRLFFFLLVSVAVNAFGDDCGTYWFNYPPQATGATRGYSTYYGYYTQITLKIGGYSYIYNRYDSGKIAMVAHESGSGIMSACESNLLSSCTGTNLSTVASNVSAYVQAANNATVGAITNHDWTAIYRDGDTVMSENELGQYLIFTKNPDGTVTASKPVGANWDSSGLASTWIGDAFDDRVADAFDSETTSLSPVASVNLAGASGSTAAAVDNPLKPEYTVDSSNGFDSVAVDRGEAVAVQEGTREGFASVVRAVNALGDNLSLDVTVNVTNENNVTITNDNTVTVTNNFGEMPDGIQDPLFWESPQEWQIPDDEGMDSDLYQNHKDGPKNTIDAFKSMIQKHLTIPEYTASFGTLEVIEFHIPLPTGGGWDASFDLSKIYVNHIRNFFLFLFQQPLCLPEPS